MDKGRSSQSEDANIVVCSPPTEAGLAGCRVCQCYESDKMGNATLGYLGICPPATHGDTTNQEDKLHGEIVSQDIGKDSSAKREKFGHLEFVSPKGEIFVCNADIEMGYAQNEDRLLELGCACKNDLALVHYACALKWFVSHGSTVCEICGCVANNIRNADMKKVKDALKEYEILRERTANGEPVSAQLHQSTGVDPDAVAAIKRQRLSEISLWFNPNIHMSNSLVQAVNNEQPSTSNTRAEEPAPADNTAAKWAVEGTGILLATGLLTVTLAWLLAPRVGKKTAKNGLHILLGGICALTVVIFFRFFVLTRIKYGPARYWAILFVFWFLVFSIWASRTYGAHAT